MLRKTISKAVVGLLTVSFLAVGISTTTEASHYTQNRSYYTYNYSTPTSYQTNYKTYTYQTNAYGSYKWVWNGTSWKLVKQQPVQQQPIEQKPVEKEPEQKPAPVQQQPTQTTPAEETPSKEQVAKSEVQQVLDLVNAERKKAGLQPLKLNTKLTDVATKKAADMRDNNYFSHTSPTYGSPFNMMKQFGINYSTAGENIAAGQRSPEEVMKAWMNSTGHRANILNKSYTEIGIGYVEGGSYGNYWVQMFIRP